MGFNTCVYQACETAEEFLSIYCETMDRRSRSLTGLHLDKNALMWDGNVAGLEVLAGFSDVLPSSEF